MSGEKIIYRAYLHWIVFLWPAVWFVLAIWFFSQGGNGPGVTLGFIFILITLLHALIAFISYKTSEFGITNKRVLAKVGFIRRNSFEILLSKVEGIQVKQGILGRMLDYGSIVISGTGGSKDPFHKISLPLEFRRKAQEQLALVQKAA